MATKSRTPVLDFDFSKFADFNTLGSQFKVPGVDPAAFVEMQRRNVEAFTAANRVAYEGVQAIAQRQVEILCEAMTPSGGPGMVPRPLTRSTSAQSNSPDHRLL